MLPRFKTEQLKIASSINFPLLRTRMLFNKLKTKQIYRNETT